MVGDSRFTKLVLLLLMFGSAAFAQDPSKNPVDPEVAKITLAARSLLGQGKIAEAEKLLKSAPEKHRNHPGVLYLLGYCHLVQKQYDAALGCYEKTKASPRFKARSHYNIAAIHALKNQKKEAFASLEEAIKAGFNNFGQLEGDGNFANLKSDPQFQKLLPEKLPDEKLFAEPARIIHKWVGETAGDQFGWTARKAGDIDQDGVEDLITTAPTFQNGSGKVYVYSGRSGKLLRAITGKKGERLGNSAVGIGDMNADGIPDWIAGAPASDQVGRAYVYSGKDGKVLHTLKGKKVGAQFGYEVSELGDFDGDATPDFFVGALSGDGEVKGSGRGVVYSGKNGKVLFEVAGERKGDGFGNAAAAARIADGSFLLAIGAPNAGPNQRGRVYVYSVESAKPKLKFRIEGDANSVNLGQMFISFPGDLNQDGVPDVYASDFSDNTKVRGGGKVVVVSGVDGKELVKIFGTVAGEGLGTSPSDAGDVDGDGVGDLVIGAWQNREGAASGGKVYLYSGAKGGKLLRTWTCKQSGDTLGFDATGMGDVDGDGDVDFLLTSAWSNARGPKTGRVFIVAGNAGKSELNPDKGEKK